MMTNLHDLNKRGQSIWYDNIQRSLLNNGELQQLIDAGVTGVTSNPTIFEKAIVGSSDYDDDFIKLVDQAAPKEIYEALAIDDIQRTADLLRPVYEKTGGFDGYVSLEVSPTLAHDTDGTIAEAQRLYRAVDRPNVMIKIPATPAGVPAIAYSISQGININVTLIFSLAQYEAVANAYIEGLERLAQQGGDVSTVASVASFFVSRVDSLVDKQLEQHGVHDLQGTIAIANAKVAYARFREIFSGPRWEKLAQQGAREQRPLWASTGTKNPDYPDTLYVDNLIGPCTVDTMPPATLSAYMDHGTVSETLETKVDEAQAQLERLRKAGIDMDAVTRQLQDDGVAAFANSFESLIDGIAQKRDRLQAEQASTV
jgi:transaldolase